jgi:hypothetical protein
MQVGVKYVNWDTCSQRLAETLHDCEKLLAQSLCGSCYNPLLLQPITVHLFGSLAPVKCRKV